MRTKRRKRLAKRPRVEMTVPEAANQRWSMDFVSDQLATGSRFRILNVVDDYTRECVIQVVDFSISVNAFRAFWISCGHSQIACADRL